MCVVALFLLGKSTRVTALVLLFFYTVYFFMYDYVEGTVFWFVAVSFLDFLTCRVILILHNKMYTVRWVGYFSFLAIPFTFLGWVLYEYGYPGIVNDYLGLFIMVAQLLAMAWRLLLDAGLGRCYTHYRVLRSINSAIHQRHHQVQNKTYHKKAFKCQK